MREVLDTARDELAAGRAVGIATVVGAEGSSPREIGASMLVTVDGRAYGNVSAGCVDGAVYERCVEALGGAPATTESFGIADDDAFAVGLSCGGTIRVLVRAVLPGSDDARALGLLATREADAVATVLRMSTAGPDAGALSVHEPGSAPTPAGCLDLAFGSPPRLIVIGAVEVAVSLAALGAAAGYRVVVVDPREVFARADRFPGAEVVVDHPGRYLRQAALDARSAVCVLTHDPKFDVPALEAALESPAGYVGAMGSRATCADRIRRLALDGVAPAALARLRSPIGLDLGGAGSMAVALSILAEVVAVAGGGTGMPLRERTGPIHGRGPAVPGPAVLGPAVSGPAVSGPGGTEGGGTIGCAVAPAGVPAAP